MKWRPGGKSKLPITERERGESTGGENINSLSINSTDSDTQILLLIYLPSGNSILAKYFSQTAQP